MVSWLSLWIKYTGANVYWVICIKTIELLCISGNTNEYLNFTYGEGASADRGCGVVFQEEFWYFGGSSSRARQVSST